MGYTSVHEGLTPTKGLYPKRIKSIAYLHILYIYEIQFNIILIYTPIFLQGAAYLCFFSNHSFPCI